MAPLITLTTDFGTRDAYVAELKGTLLSEGPADLRIVDLSHELAPFDVHAAALFVRAALPRFPAGTIHVVVVDPGVGTARAALVIKLRDMTLVGPDNSLFSYLYDGSEEVYAIERGRLGAREISSTFHGRDVFAPVAARLAAGAKAEDFGARAEAYKRMAFPMVEVSGDALHGRIIHIDRYGNLITNISAATLRGFIGGELAGRLDIAIGEHRVRDFVDCYAQGKPGELVALIGSAGLLEVAAREESAASRLHVEVGRTLRVQRND
jgi:S-adenosylmethionine hydrolase